MTTTDKTGTLAWALFRVQEQLKKLPLDGSKPGAGKHTKAETVVELVREALLEQGLVLSGPVQPTEIVLQALAGDMVTFDSAGSVKSTKPVGPAVSVRVTYVLDYPPSGETRLYQGIHAHGAPYQSNGRADLGTASACAHTYALRDLLRGMGLLPKGREEEIEQAERPPRQERERPAPKPEQPRAQERPKSEERKAAKPPEDRKALRARWAPPEELPPEPKAQPEGYVPGVGQTYGGAGATDPGHDELVAAGWPADYAAELAMGRGNVVAPCQVATDLMRELASAVEAGHMTREDLRAAWRAAGVEDARAVCLGQQSATWGQLRRFAAGVRLQPATGGAA